MERKTIQARAAQKLAAEHYLRIRRRSPGEFFLSQTIGRVNAAPPYSRSVAKRARHRDIEEMGGDRRLPISRFRKGSDRKSGSAGMPRPISYAVFCLKKKTERGQDVAALLYEHPRQAQRTAPAARL